ncbi:MAG: hypothetical protein ACKOCD_06065 [Nitrospiraceae bacterium]
MRTTEKKILTLTVLLLALEFLPAESVLAQAVSGVRGINGGVGALFNLTGPGNLYVDHTGTQGYMYSPGVNFESYNFMVPGGQAWSGAMMTLGPQLTISLIAGANQSGTPTVFPPLPKTTTLPPRIQSTVLLPEDIP